MKLLSRYKECTYNIGFIKRDKNIFQDGIGVGDIIWMKHDYKDRFFADPFLIRIDNDNLYVICEEFVFWERVGKIVLLTIDRKCYELKKRKVLIKEKYHLSFPFCRLNGEWVIPEASWSGKSYAYQLNLKNMEVQKKVLIAEEGLIDNIFYKDKEDTLWMYAGNRKDENEAIYAYRLNETGVFEKYFSNPVEVGFDRSRCAGAFFEYEGKLCRPVQDCTERYGKQTKIMEILRIGKEGYDAKEYCVLNGVLNPLYNETMHTFNIYNDIILVDGSKDILRVRNLFYTRFWVRIWSYVEKFISLIVKKST